MSKGRRRWHCKACQKAAFGSQSRAEDALAYIASESNSSTRPKRAYPCPYGNGWHLTSQEANV